MDFYYYYYCFFLFSQIIPIDIVIPLQHRIGQFIKIELIYTGEWLQLSEISFDFNLLPSDLTFDQKSQLFEWTHSEAYAISAAAGNSQSTGSGTRYVMMAGHDNHSSDHHHYNIGIKNKYPIGNDNQEGQALKYSLIIACLCTLGKYYYKHCSFTISVAIMISVSNYFRFSYHFSINIVCVEKAQSS